MKEDGIVVYVADLGKSFHLELVAEIGVDTAKNQSSPVQSKDEQSKILEPVGCDTSTANISLVLMLKASADIKKRFEPTSWRSSSFSNGCSGSTKSSHLRSRHSSLQNLVQKKNAFHKIFCVLCCC